MVCLTCLSICILSLPCWSGQSSPCALLGQRFYLCSSNLLEHFSGKPKLEDHLGKLGGPSAYFHHRALLAPRCKYPHSGDLSSRCGMDCKWAPLLKNRVCFLPKTLWFLTGKKKILNICHSSKKDSASDPKEQNLKQKNAQRIWMVYRKGNIQEKLNPTLNKVNAK